MATWTAKYGSTYQAVSHDGAAVGLDINADDPNVTTLRADCTKLRTDVSKGLADPPMPMASLETQYAVILGDLSKAAQACVTGIDQQNTSDLDKMATYFSNAGSASLTLLKAIEQFS
jgi:hypothetical protein